MVNIFTSKIISPGFFIYQNKVCFKPGLIEFNYKLLVVYNKYSKS